MIHRAALAILSLASAQPLAAQEDLQCFGVLPGWSLSVTGGQSILTTDRNIAMEVMDETHAEGDRDWPRALTLVGRDDTAILVLDQEQCQLNGRAYPLQSLGLTQYGTVPILLTGCCGTAND